MAYFRCVGGVGGGAVLTLTYSSEFYGETITATDGTKTVTKVAPSTGTMDITLPESGTWVVSATIDDQTYSTTVTVDLEYTASLEAIPDGSTVTPTDDIQTWLKCAGIRDKTTYTTLSDVLGDTETLIALCADSNACDYMARSTNWASGVAADSTAMLIVGKYNYCANKLLSNSTWAEAICNSTYIDSVLNIKVPTMTSATAPSGTVDSNGDYGSGFDKWRAFNPSESQGWVPNHGGAQAGYYLVGDWLSYDFGYSVCISYVELSYINTSTPNNIYFKIQGSNDNFVSDIHDLCSEQTITGVASTTVTTKVALGNATNYAKHRVYISTNSSSSGGKGLKVQFYGRTDNANYIPLVPRMTSDTTPSGECICSRALSGYEAYKAFDGAPLRDTAWVVAQGAPAVIGDYLGYIFDTAKIVKRITMLCKQFTEFMFEGSNDGTTWYDIQRLELSGEDKLYDFIIDNNTAYTHYRLRVTANSSDNNPPIWVLQFYKESTLPIIHSAVEDSIFYMNDGSPVALCGIPVGDTIDVDLEAYKGQTLTLVSTVAKDPTNLSNDYSKSIRITPNVTEIYLMPNKALYWWGYNNSSNPIVAMTTANGWSSSPVASQITFNKNNITNSGNSVSGFATTNKISSMSKIISIAQGSTGWGATKGQTLVSSDWIRSELSGTLSKQEITIPDTDGYYVGTYKGSGSYSSTFNALWYE